MSCHLHLFGSTEVQLCHLLRPMGVHGVINPTHRVPTVTPCREIARRGGRVDERSDIYKLPFYIRIDSITISSGGSRRSGSYASLDVYTFRTANITTDLHWSIMRIMNVPRQIGRELYYNPHKRPTAERCAQLLRLNQAKSGRETPAGPNP